MATRNGAAGPSNLKSSENLMAVCAVAAPLHRAAARMSPARSGRRLSTFMSVSLDVIRWGVPKPCGWGAGVLFPAQQRTCRMKEQGRTAHGHRLRTEGLISAHQNVRPADAAGNAAVTGAGRLV